LCLSFQLFNAAICIALANLPLYKQLGAHFFLYYMTCVPSPSFSFISVLTVFGADSNVGGGMSGLLFSWASEACSTNNEERSLVIALMNNLVRVFFPFPLRFPFLSSPYFSGSAHTHHCERV
jgi:ACS family pantothenate transporter-like MFS transporter